MQVSLNPKITTSNTMLESGISIHLHVLWAMKAMVVWVFYTEFYEKAREGFFIIKVVAKGTF